MKEGDWEEARKVARRWLTPKGKGNPEVHEKGRGKNALSEWTMGLGEKSAFPLFCKSLTSPSLLHVNMY